MHDVRDVTGFDDGEFDAVVAFGGALSYVFEDAEHTFHGLVNVTKQKGFVVGSVMSSAGAFR